MTNQHDTTAAMSYQEFLKRYGLQDIPDPPEKTVDPYKLGQQLADETIKALKRKKKK